MLGGIAHERFYPGEFNLDSQGSFGTDTLLSLSPVHEDPSLMNGKHEFYEDTEADWIRYINTKMEMKSVRYAISAL